MPAQFQLYFRGSGLDCGVVVGAFTHCLKRILIGSDRPKLSLTLKNAAGALDVNQQWAHFFLGTSNVAPIGHLLFLRVALPSPTPHCWCWFMAPSELHNMHSCWLAHERWPIVWVVCELVSGQLLASFGT